MKWLSRSSGEESALARVLRDDAECAEALVDEIGVDAFAVVGADELIPPASEGGDAQASHACVPCLQESRVGGADPKLDPAALTSGSGDRRVGVRHHVGGYLSESDPGLREVLVKVTPSDLPWRSFDASIATERG